MNIENKKMHFFQVQSKHKPIIVDWFSQAHVKEFYYGEGLQNTLKNLELYCQGINNNGKYSFDHWIAYLDDSPLGFLMTSPVEPSENDEMNKWCVSGSKTSTLDLLIGNTRFLGKGLSAPMIRAFILDKFSGYDYFLIDPEKDNTKAIHVYEKAGFDYLGEFSPSYNPVPHVILANLFRIECLWV